MQIRALPAHLKSATSGIWQPYCQNMNILVWRPPSIITHLRQTQKYAYQDESVDDDVLLNATIGDCRQREDLHGAAFYCVAWFWRSVAVQAEG